MRQWRGTGAGVMLDFVDVRVAGVRGQGAAEGVERGDHLAEQLAGVVDVAVRVAVRGQVARVSRSALDQEATSGGLGPSPLWQATRHDGGRRAPTPPMIMLWKVWDSLTLGGLSETFPWTLSWETACQPPGKIS